MNGTTSERAASAREKILTILAKVPPAHGLYIAAVLSAAILAAIRSASDTSHRVCIRKTFIPVTDASLKGTLS